MYFWTLVFQWEYIIYHNYDATVYSATCLYSDRGEVYAKKLANFVEKRLKSERAASVSFIHMNDSTVKF